MVLLIIILIILPIVAGAIWWYFFLVRPLQRAKNNADMYSAKLLFFLTVNISTVIYAAISGVIVGKSIMIYAVIFAAISPPAAIIIVILTLYDVHFAAFEATIILLLCIYLVVLLKTSGTKRLAIALLAVIPICTIPLMVQGYVSITKIKSEYVRLGGQCLSNGAFVQSLKNPEGFTDKFHAVMIKDNAAFIWSYKKQMFVDSDFGANLTLTYAPNSACDEFRQPRS